MQNVSILIYPPVAVYNDFESGDMNNGYCVFQATVKTSFDLSSILWTCIIMFNIFATVVRKIEVDKLEVLYLAIGFAVPVLLCLM